MEKKKNVFSMNVGESIDLKNRKQNKVTENQKIMLFDDNDETLPDLKLKINAQFTRKSFQKFLELKTKYSSDSRFNLDSRFYESESEEEKETEENPELSTEKQKQLLVLEKLLPQEIKPISYFQDKLKPKYDNMFLRFDPTREEHGKYLKKSKKNCEETKNSKNSCDNKNKRKSQRDFSKADLHKENKTVVSSEKIFTITEDLKEAFKSGSESEFSLLKLFRPLETQHREPQDYEVENNTFKTEKWSKYDSEIHDELDVDVVQQERQSKPPNDSLGARFFIGDDNPKLQGVFEFIKGAEDESKFDETRKLLKRVIKNKYKNCKRKNKMFKKKLGKMKITKFI